MSASMTIVQQASKAQIHPSTLSPAAIQLTSLPHKLTPLPPHKLTPTTLPPHQLTHLPIILTSSLPPPLPSPITRPPTHLMAPLTQFIPPERIIRM